MYCELDVFFISRKIFPGEKFKPDFSHHIRAGADDMWSGLGFITGCQRENADRCKYLICFQDINF